MILQKWGVGGAYIKFNAEYRSAFRNTIFLGIIFVAKNTTNLIL